MNTLAAFATTAGACALVAVVAITEPALAGKGSTLNGPPLDGRQVILPDWAVGNQEALPPDTVDTAEFAKLAGNGPSLDGQQVILPDGPVGEREVLPPDTADNAEFAKLAGNGPSLNGQRAMLPVAPQRASTVPTGVKVSG